MTASLNTCVGVGGDKDYNNILYNVRLNGEGSVIDQCIDADDIYYSNDDDDDAVYTNDNPNDGIRAQE